MVTPAAPADFATACRLLAARRPVWERDEAARRFLDLLTTGEFDPAGLFVARAANGDIRGAVLAQALPGALGLLFPPRTARAGPTDDLMTAALDWLRGRGVKVCQSFAPAGDRSDEATLDRVGFCHVTAVVHLRNELTPAAGETVAGPLEIAPTTPADRPAFTAALLESHDGSLDCPELTGTRTAADLLDGFGGAAPVRPGWWFLARAAGAPVGVVMLEPGSEPAAVELGYLGLVPAARGRGWGDALVRAALRAAAADGGAAVTLSVDARNTPARRVYARHGFRETGRRDVFIRHAPGAGPTSPEIAAAGENPGRL